MRSVRKQHDCYSSDDDLCRREEATAILLTENRNYRALNIHYASHNYLFNNDISAELWVSKFTITPLEKIRQSIFNAFHES